MAFIHIRRKITKISQFQKTQTILNLGFHLLIYFTDIKISIYIKSAKIYPHPDKIAKGGEDAYYVDKKLTIK